MVDATRAPMGIIARVITHGDIAPLLPIMDASPDVNDIVLMQAQQIMRTVLLHMVPNTAKSTAKCYKDGFPISANDVYLLYAALSGTQMKATQFSKSLKAFGGASLGKKQYRYTPTQPEKTKNQKQFSGYKIYWKTNYPDVVGQITMYQQNILSEMYGATGGFPDYVQTLQVGGHLEFQKPNI